MVDLGTIASGIYVNDLDSDPSTSIAAVSGWLTSNIGALNNLINATYTVVSGDASPQLGDDEADIYRETFLVNFYARRVNSNLGAASYNSSILEVTEGNRTIRVSNRNEIAKVFLTLKKEAQVSLQELVAMYRMNRANPKQVAGADYFYDGNGSFNPLGQHYRNYYDLE